MLTLFSLPAGAATFTVTNLNNSGAGSLRQAILTANATAGNDTIAFQSGLSGTITLTSGHHLYIDSNLAINGPGANQLAISGNHAFRIFYIASGNMVTINGLTLKEGAATLGGGIHNYKSTLAVNNCTITGNVAQNGSGIENYEGTLTVNNSVLSGNGDSTTVTGGGIFNYNGMLTVNNSTITGNFGDGIGNSGTLTITNSTLSGNSCSSNCNGGGIHNGVNHKLTITNSTLSGNTCSGASCNGGGIVNFGTLTITNSTLSSNSCSSANCFGGGIFTSIGTVNIGNSLVSGNTAPTTGKEVDNSFGTFTSQGHNLFGQNGASGVTGATLDPSDIVPSAGVTISQIIGPLANNGGPTQTRILVAGSLAINHGNNALIPAGVITDQRGYGPRIVNGTVDIGAVEVGATASTYPLTVTKTGGNGLVTSTPAGINCGVTCAANFNSGAKVTLAAKPDADYSFTGWAGDCNGTTCVVIMTAAKNVTALFANIPAYTVTVRATDSTATEAGLTPGVFTFTRTGNTAAALAVAYAVAGTATAGSDYGALGTSVVIPAGANTVTKTVTPLQDILQEPNETVILSLAQSPNYAVGTPGSATVTLSSDE